MWVSSWVRFTPSIKLVTTRGSRLYSWRTLMSLGFAQIWHTVDQHTCCNYKNLYRLPVRYVTFLWQFLPPCKNFSSVILLVLAVHWQLCNYSLYKPMFDTDKVNRYLKHSLHIFTNSIFCWVIKWWLRSSKGKPLEITGECFLQYGGPSCRSNRRKYSILDIITYMSD